jgi:hypothetical protein
VRHVTEALEWGDGKIRARCTCGWIGGDNNSWEEPEDEAKRHAEGREMAWQEPRPSFWDFFRPFGGERSHQVRCEKCGAVIHHGEAAMTKHLDGEHAGWRAP